MDKAVVDGEYVTYSHIKTRKTFTITIEFPEEKALEVLNILGAPVAESSNPVAVCLLDKSNIQENPSTGITEHTTKEKTEGEKLRIRAVMLCKELKFWEFTLSYIPQYGGEEYRKFVDDLDVIEKRYKCCEGEAHAILVIYNYCGIDSRSELTTNNIAQKAFKSLDKRYKEWLNPIEEQYKDNLER